MSTTEKALKKRKLRHAEYYDFQRVQDQLYADSLKDKMFTGLVDIIIRPEVEKNLKGRLKKRIKTAESVKKRTSHAICQE